MSELLSPLAAIIMICATLAPSVTNAASIEDQVNSAYAIFDTAFNKSDAKAVATLYTDDSLLLPPSHEIIKGPTAIEKFFTGLFANGVTGHKLELIQARADGTQIVGAARWSAKAKDGSSISGIATHVFAKQPDGSLKLVLHTFN
jgi:uncharacterized protein (TIGR02246 family)